MHCEPAMVDVMQKLLYLPVWSQLPVPCCPCYSELSPALPGLVFVKRRPNRISH